MSIAGRARTIRPMRSTRSRIEGCQEESLRRAPDAPTLVDERGLRKSDTVRLGEGDRVESDPFTLGGSMQQHGEVGVDEGEPTFEVGADAVREVRRGGDALQRCG